MRQHSVSARVLSALTTFVLLSVVCSLAVAQDVSDDQVKLNRQAIEALQSGEYERAITLFEALLGMSKVNVIYLNYGRALTKAGRCADARAAFDKVPDATPVEAPPRDAVLQKLEEYRGFLDTECPGTLQLTCKPSDANVSIDGGAAAPCKSSYKLTPGEHEVVASVGEASSTQTVAIEAEKTTTLTIDVEVPGIDLAKGPDDPPDKGKEPAAAGEGPGLGTWLLIGGGVAALVGALVVDQAVLGPGIEDLEDAADKGDQEEYDDLKPDLESQQTLVLGLAGAGVVAIGIGGILWLSSGTAPENNKIGSKGSPLPILPWVGEGTAGVSSGFRF